MTRCTSAVLLCLASLLAACDASVAPTAADTPPGAAPPASPAVSVAPSRCPDADFDAFLERFAASADAQRAATADPLTMTRLDPDAQPEPAPVVTRVPRARVEFPVLADAATREAEGSQLRVESPAADAREVIVGLPDSDAQVRFGFELRDCWTLVRVDDESM